jgi:hypothetical protein
VPEERRLTWSERFELADEVRREDRQLRRGVTRQLREHWLCWALFPFGVALLVYWAVWMFMYGQPYR